MFDLRRIFKKHGPHLLKSERILHEILYLCICLSVRFVLKVLHVMVV